MINKFFFSTNMYCLKHLAANQISFKGVDTADGEPDLSTLIPGLSSTVSKFNLDPLVIDNCKSEKNESKCSIIAFCKTQQFQIYDKIESVYLITFLNQLFFFFFAELHFVSFTTKASSKATPVFL
jgi:hypothetical protein